MTDDTVSGPPTIEEMMDSWRQKHVRGDFRCLGCNHPYPCEIRMLLDHVDRLEGTVARLREGIEAALYELDSEHFRDPEDTRLCRCCRERWPCVTRKVLDDLRALLAGEETTDG